MILNTAGIYLDYNDPVITVTTTNLLVSIPEPDASFTSQLVSTNGAWVYDLAYTGGTATNAAFAWHFGADATPATSADQNPRGISYATEGLKLVTLVLTRYGCLTTHQMVVWAGPCEGTPRLSVSRVNDRVIVSWTDCGILQTAESLAGPWRDVLARSPHVENLNARQRFYRTRK